MSLHNKFYLTNNKLSIYFVGGNMKDTGIVRRIDELGRIVIPKEIRRTMRLKEGTAVQIYINKSGELTLTKYSPIVDITEFANTFCSVINDNLSINLVVTDKDFVIATTNKLKGCLGKEISAKLEEILEERKSYLFNVSDNSKMLELFKDDSNTYYSQMVVPILANSDVVGGIVAFTNLEKETNFSMTDVKILQVIAGFLARQVE